MSRLKIECLAFIPICSVCLVACAPAHVQPESQSGLNDNVQRAPADELARVNHPQAVIRFRVGAKNSLEITEGLHYKTSQRRQGHLTSVDVNGDEFDLRWEYLGSDQHSDKYRITLNLPGDQEPSQKGEVQYFGEPSVSFYNSDRVAVAIENSRAAPLKKGSSESW